MKLITASVLVILIIFVIIIYISNKDFPINIGRPVTYEDYILEKYIDKKILIYQCGSYEKKPEFVEKSIELSTNYCKKHGYDYKCFFHDSKEMPVYWLKAHNLKKILDENYYDYIVFLDFDVYINKFNLPLSVFIDKYMKKVSILVSKDSHKTNKYNTGVFIVKNNDYSKQFVSKWVGNCLNEDNELVDKCSNWKLDDSKWVCKNCKWAGENYEQGVFNKLAYLETEIINLPFDVFVSPAWYFFTYKNCFFVHMMATSNEYRNNVFRRLVI